MATVTEPTIRDVIARIDKMDKRLTERLDKIDGRLDSMNRRLNGLENRVAATEQLLIKLTAASPVPV